MKDLFINLCFLFFSILAYSQSSSDTIFWSNNYKLVWSDFQGIPDTPSKYGAVSNPIIKYHLSSNEDSFKVKVICFFIKSSSWSKFKNSDTLLMHEQGHFDISEIFARKLRKEFAEYKFNYRTVGHDIDKLFRINKQQCLEMDSLYDKETNLSRYGKQQIIWQNKIKLELDKLQKFASS